MIDWPCIMKLEGDDELLYFSNANEFLNECQSLILNSSDFLIDSSGHSYKLNQKNESDFNFIISTQRYSADDLSKLVQAHEFSKAEVCLTKIHFQSVSEAISSLSISK